MTTAEGSMIHTAGCGCVYCEHNRDVRCVCQPCVWIRVEFGEIRTGREA